MSILCGFERLLFVKTVNALERTGLFILLINASFKHFFFLLNLKNFRDGLKKKVVVKNLSINLYENQITGFLGHNGAGKVKDLKIEK